jgi:hypothetical protein
MTSTTPSNQLIGEPPQKPSGGAVGSLNKSLLGFCASTCIFTSTAPAPPLWEIVPQCWESLTGSARSDDMAGPFTPLQTGTMYEYATTNFIACNFTLVTAAAVVIVLYDITRAHKQITLNQDSAFWPLRGHLVKFIAIGLSASSSVPGDPALGPGQRCGCYGVAIPVPRSASRSCRLCN